MTSILEQRELHPVPGRPRVGRVSADFIVRNRADQIAVSFGLLRAEEVRELRLDHVLVDTGADVLFACRESTSQRSAWVSTTW